MPLTSEQRADIAIILEDIAKNGMPLPRDLDVALDAIEATIDEETPTQTPLKFNSAWGLE